MQFIVNTRSRKMEWTKQMFCVEIKFQRTSLLQRLRSLFLKMHLSLHFKLKVHDVPASYFKLFVYHLEKWQGSIQVHFKVPVVNPSVSKLISFVLSCWLSVHVSTLKGFELKFTIALAHVVGLLFIMKFLHILVFSSSSLNKD